MILVARAYDLSRKREAQAVSLETRISRSSVPIHCSHPFQLSDGEDPVVAGLTCHHHDDGLGSAIRVPACRARADPARSGKEARTYRIEDGIVVDPAMAKRAA